MAPDYAARYPGACRTSCCSTPAACISSPTHRHAPSARGGRAAIVVTSAGANRLRIGGPTSWLTHEPENEIGVSTYRQGHLRRSWPGGYLSQDIAGCFSRLVRCRQPSSDKLEQVSAYSVILILLGQHHAVSGAGQKIFFVAVRARLPSPLGVKLR
jgi:hypothetical protein